MSIDLSLQLRLNQFGAFPLTDVASLLFAVVVVAVAAALYLFW